jgi:transposase
MKALLHTQGLIDVDDDTVISQHWIASQLKQVEAHNIPPGFTYALNYYVDKWEQLTKELNAMKGELVAMQTEAERQLMAIYQSAPGVGTINALKILGELGDMSQFTNEKPLFSYLGLTPSEYSSREHVRQGHISRQGRPVLRQLFVESAWVAIKKDPTLMDVYQRLASKKGGKRAIVAVVRRLAGRLRSCANNNTHDEIKASASAQKK